MSTKPNAPPRFLGLSSPPIELPDSEVILVGDDEWYPSASAIRDIVVLDDWLEKVDQSLVDTRKVTSRWLVGFLDTVRVSCF